MEHKAFVFDHVAFRVQFGDILWHVLATDDLKPLIGFVRAHEGELTDPYEGAPLESDWEDRLEARDVQEYGDYALTKFYDPGNNIGLSHDWWAINELLERELPGGASAALGEPFGPSHNLFDPGRMGAYFQSPDQVARNLRLVDDLGRQKPDLTTTLSRLRRMLKRAADTQKGLYVTF
jgi:hypothetical protein